MCRGFDVYALESAGNFCMCLTSDEAAATTAISERECRPSCASSGRLHANLPGLAVPLPCGGSEAVAMFRTQPAVAALAADAVARAQARIALGLANKSSFQQALQERQGLSIAAPEEIAWRQGWIDDGQLETLGRVLAKNSYGQYLLDLLEGD